MPRCHPGCETWRQYNGGAAGGRTGGRAGGWADGRTGGRADGRTGGRADGRTGEPGVSPAYSARKAVIGAIWPARRAGR